MNQNKYYEAYCIVLVNDGEQAAFGYSSDEMIVFNDKEKAEAKLKSLKSSSLFQRMFKTKNEYENATVETVLIPKLI